MDNAQIFALRLKNARLLKNMSMAALSNALGDLVSPQAIYKYESGKMLPSSNVIIELSRIFEVPMDYFFRPVTTTITGVEFRKKYKLGVKEKNTIQAKATEILERYVEISDICNETRLDFTVSEGPISTKEDVIRVVSDLRNKWNLSENGIDNVIAFLESLGIIVIEIEATMDFDGFSGMACKTPIIVLNKDYTPERKRFTALHELGHLVMRFEPEVTDKDVERLCHLFAGEMLISATISTVCISHGSIKNSPTNLIVQRSMSMFVSLMTILSIHYTNIAFSIISCIGIPNRLDALEPEINSSAYAR